MENEIELKLLLPDGINESDLLAALTHFSANIETSEFTLFNQYFDTPDSLLSAHGIGLRIRSSERGIEQTVKTAGTSVGGLHQRPEYNVAIDSLEPDLELFERHIWPAEINVIELQESIVQVFHTDFRRLAHFMRLSDGTDIEIVYDRGQITTAENSADICEIELELKSGNVAVLFDLAEKISGIAVTQLCNISKAGRGFLLAKNQLAPDAEVFNFVKISREDSCEDAFIKGLEYSLSFWQKAEYRYTKRKKIADLVDIYAGMNLTLTCLNIFSEVLAHDELLDLKKALGLRIKRWAWIEQVDSIKNLRSKRGMYAKPLAPHHALTSYLRGLQDGTLTLSRPMFLITQKDNTLLQLALSKMLITKPWRAVGNHHEAGIREHASRQLAKSWGHVFNTFANKGMGAEDYLKHAAKLRDGLRVNCLLGKAYSEFRRQPFNAPWQDILEGIDELHTINVLKTKLKDSDVEDKAELLQWCEVKKNTLLSVIDQSKAVATDVETYW